MKIKFAIILIIACCLNLVACNNNKKENENSSKDILSYDIADSNYSINDNKMKCNIIYPSIIGLDDLSRQDQINALIESEAKKALNYYKDTTSFLDLNLNYEISLKSEDILSIQYSGIGLVTDAVHPNKLFYTTNIDMKSGDKIRLIDIINIDKHFAKKFLDGDFRAIWPEQTDALDYYDANTVLAYFENADTLDCIGTEKQSDVYSYFTNDSLGISIYVSFAIGEHAEFEIEYNKLSNNVQNGSDVILELIGN